MSGGLANRRIVNTRAAHQAEALDLLLRQFGALPISYPCIEIVPPADCRELDETLEALARGDYQWLLLTSSNTVDALAQRLRDTRLNLPPACAQVAAVGPATAHAAQTRLGLAVSILPEAYVAESLASSVPLQAGDRVLLPESALARPALADGLTARGARVDVVAAYETVCGHGGADVPGLAAHRALDAILFTSSSTATCFHKRFAAEAGRFDDLQGICCACIGEKTAATAREVGFSVSVVPAASTLEALVETLDTYFQQETLSASRGIAE